VARAIGCTKSWLWWLAGCCARCFSRRRRAPGGGGQVRRDRSAAGRAAAGERGGEAEGREAPGGLLRAAGRRGADREQKVTVKKLIEDLAPPTSRSARRPRPPRQAGPGGAGLLREAAKSGDAEVVTRTNAAVTPSRPPAAGTVGELKKLQNAAATVIVQQMNDTARRWARRPPPPLRPTRPAMPTRPQGPLHAQGGRGRSGALTGLYRQIVPMMLVPAPLYGVRAAPLD